MNKKKKSLIPKKRISEEVDHPTPSGHPSGGGELRTVPKMRFPEFRGKEKWEMKKLGDCLIKNPEYGINAPAVPYSETLPAYIRITDISDDGHYLKEKKVSVASIVNEENYLKENDILFARTGASVGKFYKYTRTDGRLVFAGFLIRVSTNLNLLKSDYLFQYLFTDNYSKWVKFISTRSGQPGINSKELSSLIIPLPSLPEQQKIADCLSSLDELITAENQQLEVLKTHKKGLMQKLFPEDVESSEDGSLDHPTPSGHPSKGGELRAVPKMRFPEFRGKGKWELKKLGDVAKYENGKAHEQDIIEVGKYIVVNSKFISTDGEIRKYTNIPFCLAKEGDILMVLSDVPNGKAIAKCFVVDKDDLYSVNQRICKITSYNSYSKLLFYILNRNIYFLKFDDGVKQTNLKNDDVLKFTMLLPPSLPEQQKIADCLSSLDELITAQAKKVELLKTHKKALLQGLFPGETN